MEKTFKYPIKVVSQMTGLSEYVIRAWEKRYGTVNPSRTGTNRRLYSEEDIQKLKLLNDAVQRGHNIGGVAKLPINELQAILASKPVTSISKEDFSNVTFTDFNSVIDNCIEAIKDYNAKRFETYLLKASSKMSQPQLIERLIVPLVYKIGDLWQDGYLRVANEHLASAIIRSFLSNLIERQLSSENAPVIISSTPCGQEHEFGAMIAGVVAASAGWKVIYLGPNLPVEEIAAAADILHAKVVALSIVYPSDDLQLKKDLLNLKQMLPENIYLIVGGRSAPGYTDILNEINAIIVNDTKQLSIELGEIRENRQN